MTELQEGDELRLMMGGEVVGTGVVLPDGNASFQLDSGAVCLVGEKLVRAYSIEPEVNGAPSPSSGPRCFGLSGCKYDEPHEHGFACDRACTVCNGWTPGTEVRPDFDGWQG